TELGSDRRRCWAASAGLSTSASWNSPKKFLSTGILAALVPDFTVRGGGAFRADGPLASTRVPSAAPHGIAAIQALVAGAVADREVTAAIAHRRIPHELFELGVERAVRRVRCRRERGTRRLGFRCRHQLGHRRVLDRRRFFGGLHLREIVALEVLDAEDA